MTNLKSLQEKPTDVSIGGTSIPSAFGFRVKYTHGVLTEIANLYSTYEANKITCGLQGLFYLSKRFVRITF